MRKGESGRERERERERGEEREGKGGGGLKRNSIIEIVMVK